MHTDTVFCLLTDNVGADVLLHGQLHRLFDEAMQKVLEEPVLLGTSQRSVAMKNHLEDGSIKLNPRIPLLLCW